MYTPDFGNNGPSPISDTSVHYLILPSESKDVAAAGRGSFAFHNRYLAKQRMLRTFRRLRRTRLA